MSIQSTSSASAARVLSPTREDLETANRVLQQVIQSNVGYFEDKLTRILAEYQRSANLKEAIFKAFPGHKYDLIEQYKDVSPPPIESFRAFSTNKGYLIGEDIKVLNFLEDRFFIKLLVSDQKGASEADARFDFNLLDEFRLGADPFLIRYKVLLSGESVLFIPETKEDVAFCGFLGLVEKAFNDKRSYKPVWSFPTLWDSTSPRPNILGIPEDLIQAISTENDNRAPNLGVFQSMNSSIVIAGLLKTDRLPIGRKIENLVSYGTSLLTRVFPEMDAADVEEMSHDQKFMFLRSKKSQVLNLALKDLVVPFYESSSETSTIEIVEIFKNLENILESKQSLTGLIFLIDKSLSEVKSDIQVFIDNSDHSQHITADELIYEFISSSNNGSIELNSLIAGSLMGKLNSYKNIFMQKKIESEKLAKLKSLYNDEKKQFFVNLSKICGSSFSRALQSKYAKSTLLQFQFFCSFILENDQIFPKEHKVAHLSAKNSKKLLSESFQRLERFKSNRPPEDPFVKALDSRAAEIFYEYRPTDRMFIPKVNLSSNNSLIAFSEQDVQKLIAASQKIQNMVESGDRDAIKKQTALISVIKKVILNSISTNNSLLLDKKGALLSATLEAAKIFTDVDKLKELRQSVGAFLEVLTGGSLKKSQEEAVDFLMQVATRVKIVPENTERLSRDIKRNISEIISQASPPLAFEVQRDPDYEEKLAEVQTAIQELEAFFRTQVFEVSNGYKNLIPAMEGKLPGNRLLDIPNDARTYTGIDKTYGDGYRALARLWESLYGFGKKKAKSYVTLKGDIQNNPIILGMALEYTDNLAIEAKLRRPSLKVANNLNYLQDRSKLFTSPFSKKNLADWYELARTDAVGNQDASNQAYGNFLFPFVLGFIQTESDVVGADRLQEAKMKIIEGLPSARECYNDIVSFKRQNAVPLTTTKTFLLGELSRLNQELQDNPDGLASAIDLLFVRAKRMLIEAGVQVGAWAGQRFLDFIIAHMLMEACNLIGITRIASALKLGGLLTLGCYAVGYTHGSAIRNAPFLALNTLLAYAQNWSGSGEFSRVSAVDSIVDTIRGSIQAEILSMNSLKEPGQRYNCCLYLSDMFSAIEAMKYDISEFMQRIGSIVSSTNGHNQLSVNACNLASFLMHKVIRLIPSEILSSASDTSDYGFKWQVQRFLMGYKTLLTEKRNEYPGEDKTFRANSPFNTWLRTQKLQIAADGEYYQLSVDDIIPWDDIDPAHEANQVVSFQQSIDAILALKPRFLEEQRKAFFNIRDNLAGRYSIGEDDKAQAQVILKGALWQVKYSFQLAYQAFLGINPYIIATGTTVKKALASSFFRDGIDTLQKIADFGGSVGLRPAHELGEYLKLFKDIANEAIYTGSFTPPIQDLEAASRVLDEVISALNTPEFDLLTLPLSAEWETNKPKTFLSLICAGFEERAQRSDFYEINPANLNLMLTLPTLKAFKTSITDNFSKPVLKAFLGINLENTNFMPRQPVLRLGTGRERALYLPENALPTSQRARRQLEEQQQPDFVPVDPVYYQQLNAFQQQQNMQMLTQYPHLEDSSADVGSYDYNYSHLGQLDNYQNDQQGPLNAQGQSQSIQPTYGTSEHAIQPQGSQTPVVQQPPQQTPTQQQQAQQQQQPQRQSPGQRPQNSAMPYAMMAATNAAHAFQQPQGQPQQLLQQQAQQQQNNGRIENLVGITAGTGNSPGGSYNFTASAQQPAQPPQPPARPYVPRPLPIAQPYQDPGTRLPPSSGPYVPPNMAPMLPQPPSQNWSTGSKIAAGLTGAALVASAVAAVATSVNNSKKKKRGN